MIAAIEAALTARLKAAGEAGVLGYRWATADSYPADWPSYFKERQPRAPACWSVFAGFARGEPVGFGGLRAVGNFGVVVMAENSRNESAQRIGGPTAAEPGSYQLAEDAIALLQGQDFGVLAGAVEIVACHVVNSAEITRERKVSMLALELRIPLAFQAAVIGGAAGDLSGWALAGGSGSSVSGTGSGAQLDLGDFATFHADWDAPPHPGSPDDAQADAVDSVQLETQ